MNPFWDEENQCHKLVETCNRHFGGGMTDCCNDCDKECLARQEKARIRENRKLAVLTVIPIVFFIVGMAWIGWSTR